VILRRDFSRGFEYIFLYSSTIFQYGIVIIFYAIALFLISILTISIVFHGEVFYYFADYSVQFLSRFSIRLLYVYNILVNFLGYLSYLFFKIIEISHKVNELRDSYTVPKNAQRGRYEHLSLTDCSIYDTYVRGDRMLIFAIQCKKSGGKNFTRSYDRGGIDWIRKAINSFNKKGMRTLVLIKE
jgi:hypothetical protein